MMTGKINKHAPQDHQLKGDARDQMQQVIAQYMCGYLSGHGCQTNLHMGMANNILTLAEAAGIGFTVK